MNLKKRVLVLLSTILVALGCTSFAGNMVQTPAQPIVVQAARWKKPKIWTSTKPKIIIGNRRSHIYHVYRQRSYRMNRENAVYFKSEAAARAAGYRLSKR